MQSHRGFCGCHHAHHTACQAQLARHFGSQEAAGKRLSRLLHHARRAPRLFADAVLFQAIPQVPRHGKVRLAMDWTTEDTHHVLVVSRIVDRRAGPMYWRAYDASVCKGRMKRDALAVMRRAVSRVLQAVGTRRVLGTAERGCADVALCSVRNALGMACIMRVKAGTHVSFQGRWRTWGPRTLRRHAHHRSVGALPYCARCPHAL